MMLLLAHRGPSGAECTMKILARVPVADEEAHGGEYDFFPLFSFSVLCPAMDVEAQLDHIDELSFCFYIPCSLTYLPFPSATFLSSFSRTKSDGV